MSDSEEEENFCYIGRPLPPYDEDSFPKKKPIPLEDQTAKDEQGRRRFHGAFTGGFSAGFFNTVGSLEGWTPSEFKSTRAEKATKTSQRPEDFMDAEDLGAFGIAPQTVQATSSYSSVGNKRKRAAFNEGPIPGEPVLHSILSSGNETVGYMLLRNMGLKTKTTDNDGSSQLDAEESQIPANTGKVYGCEMPRTYEISRYEDLDQRYEIPKIYQEFLDKPKSNTFGLGYSGLEGSHLNLFKSQNLVIREKGKKKFSVVGQAFGVGAFEDDDEDIYVKDDMTGYDFELTSENAGKSHSKNRAGAGSVIFDSFILAKQKIVLKEWPPPTIPHSFTGKYKMKKSRFEPIPGEDCTQIEKSRSGMNADVRARYLGEEPTNSSTEQPKTQETCAKTEPQTPEFVAPDPFKLKALDSISDRFVSGSYLDDSENPAALPTKTVETECGTAEMRAAVKMKMFGPLTRTITDWYPCPVLSKRFNVPELRAGGQGTTDRKRTKNLIFEYEKFAQVAPELVPGLSTNRNIADGTSANQGSEDSINSNSISESKTEIAADSTQNNNQTSIDNSEEVAETSAAAVPHESSETITVPDMTEKIDVEKNLDLFKSIFLSSDEEDESENEDAGHNSGKNEELAQENESAQREEEIKANVLSDSFLSKIKPMKEGILSNMDFSLINPTIVVPTTPVMNVAQSNSVDSAQNDDSLYGPRLPASLQNTQKSTKVRSDKAESEGSSDDWVEKEDKSKQHKKHHKKKQKKHKHKKKHRRH